MKKISKAITNKVNKTLDENRGLSIKLLIECWNEETPHFAGGGPHRYDGRSAHCAYCNRPKNWKPKNAGYIAMMLTEDIED